MRFTLGKISLTVLLGCLMLGHTSGVRAQTPARSSVVIPLKKERAPNAKIVTIHDTVTMVRVDTIRVVERVVRTDTVFKVDTLRDSCSRAIIPIPIPIPLGGGQDHPINQPATLDPGIVTSVAPEPETFALVGTGLATILAVVRIKRRK